MLTTPHCLRYTWRGDQGSDDITDVTYTLEPTASGTRFTWTHTGLTGPRGSAMSKLLGSVRRKMLTDGVLPVLASLHARSSSPTSPPTAE